MPKRAMETPAQVLAREVILCTMENFVATVAIAMTGMVGRLGPMIMGSISILDQLDFSSRGLFRVFTRYLPCCYSRNCNCMCSLALNIRHHQKDWS